MGSWFHRAEQPGIDGTHEGVDDALQSQTELLSPYHAANRYASQVTEELFPFCDDSRRSPCFEVLKHSAYASLEGVEAIKTAEDIGTKPEYYEIGESK